MKRTLTIIFSFLGMIILLTIPTFFELYSPFVYYAMLFIFLPSMVDQTLRPMSHKRRFVQRFEKRLERPKVFNVSQEIASTFFMIIATNAIGQYIAKGTTPFDNIRNLTNGQLIMTLIFFFFLSVFVGFFSWHQKNKQYNDALDEFDELESQDAEMITN